MLLISTFFSSFVFAEENQVESPEKLKLVALGDSITAGSGVLPEQAFPSLLENEFINVENLGVPGATSQDLVNLLKEKGGQLADADAVTITIGSNDLLQAAGIREALQNGTPVVPNQELFQNVYDASELLLARLLESISIIQSQTDAPIVIYNIYNPFGARENPVLASLHQLGEQVVNKVNTEVINAAVAATQNNGKIKVADAYSEFTDKQAEYVSEVDRIHPNVAGHQTLAGLATQLLAEYLVGNPEDPTDEDPSDEEPSEEDPVDEEPTDGEDPIGETPEEDPVLVALGDSITYGLFLEEDLSKPSSLAFPNLIDGGKYTVKNFGQPRMTSDELLNLLRPEVVLLSDSENVHSALQTADLVTLNIGSNDLLQAAGITSDLSQDIEITDELEAKLGVAGAKFKLNLQAIINIIQEQTDAPIVLYTLYNPFGPSEDVNLAKFHELGELIIPSVNGLVILPLSQSNENIILADAYSAFHDKQSEFVNSLPFDKIHPNANGHKVLAAAADVALGLEPLPPVEPPVDPPVEPEVPEEEQPPVEEEPPVEVPVEEEPGNEDPVAEEPVDEEPAEEEPVIEKPSVEVDDEETPEKGDSGNELPNTATSIYNYFAIGAALILAGIILFVVQSRRQKRVNAGV